MAIAYLEAAVTQQSEYGRLHCNLQRATVRWNVQHATCGCRQQATDNGHHSMLSSMLHARTYNRQNARQHAVLPPLHNMQRTTHTRCTERCSYAMMELGDWHYYGRDPLPKNVRLHCVAEPIACGSRRGETTLPERARYHPSPQYVNHLYAAFASVRLGS